LAYLVFLSFINHKGLKVLTISCMIVLSGLDILLFVNQVFLFVQLGDLFSLSTFLFTGPAAYQKWFFIVVFYLIFIYISTSAFFLVKHELAPTK